MLKMENIEIKRENNMDLIISDRWRNVWKSLS